MTNSTSTFSPEIILDVKDLNISYAVSTTTLRTFRDAFIHMIKSPIDFIFKDDDRFNIIENFNLTLKEGERLGILGVNGCGKTSLCRSIAGMHLKNDSIYKRGVVRAIFDSGVGVQPELTGRENAYTIATLMYPELNKRQIRELVEESIEFSEINSFIDAPFKTYSKGMKTRLFLSLISAHPSDLLILDEVFGGADVFFNEKISKRVEKLIKDSGACIFVSHTAEEIRKTCNRVIVINGFTKAFDGDVEEGIRYYHEHCHNENPR